MKRISQKRTRNRSELAITSRMKERPFSACRGTPSVSSAADPLSRSPRCLVAGGCGFIGHRVVRFLRQLGWTVEVIDNRTDYGCYDRTLHAQNHKARESALSGTIVHETSILNHAAVMQVFEEFKPEVVVHLASIPIARIAASQPIATTQETSNKTTFLRHIRSGRRNRTVHSSLLASISFEVTPWRTASSMPSFDRLRCMDRPAMRHSS